MLLPNAEFLVHDHHGLDRLASAIVDLDQRIDARLDDVGNTGREAERVGEPARHHLVGRADIDHMRQPVARRGGRRCDGDTAGIGADHRGRPGFVDFLDFGRADIGLRLRVGQKGLELRPAQRLDTAGGIDLLDRHDGTRTALVAGIGEGAGHRVQHADFDRGGLRAQDRRKSERAGGGGGAGRGQHGAAGYGTWFAWRGHIFVLPGWQFVSGFVPGQWLGDHSLVALPCTRVSFMR